MTRCLSISFCSGIELHDYNGAIQVNEEKCGFWLILCKNTSKRGGYHSIECLGSVSFIWSTFYLRGTVFLPDGNIFIKQIWHPSIKPSISKHDWTVRRQSRTTLKWINQHQLWSEGNFINHISWMDNYFFCRNIKWQKPTDRYNSKIKSSSSTISTSVA